MKNLGRFLNVLTAVPLLIKCYDYLNDVVWND